MTSPTRFYRFAFTVHQHICYASYLFCPGFSWRPDVCDADIIVLVLWKGLAIIVTTDLLRFKFMGIARRPSKIYHLIAFSMRESDQVRESQLLYFRLIRGCERNILQFVLVVSSYPELLPLSVFPVKSSVHFPFTF